MDVGALIVAVLANVIVIALVVLLILAILRRRTHEGRVEVALSWRGKAPEPPISDDPPKSEAGY